MSRRIYSESVKKWSKRIGIPAGTAGFIFLIFAFLSSEGLVTVHGFSGDTFCNGTIEEPCYAIINFTAHEDIFIYPVGYDPWGRNSTFGFDPGVKRWEFQRAWGSGWRNIPLDKGCTGTWCGGKPGITDNTFSYAFRQGKNYVVRIVAYKNYPGDYIKWSAFDGRVDPVWAGKIGSETVKEKNIIIKKGISYDILSEKKVVGYEKIFKKVNKTSTLCSLNNETGEETCENYTHTIIVEDKKKIGKPIFVEKSRSIKVNNEGKTKEYVFDSKGCWVCGEFIACLSKKDGFSENRAEKYKCDENNYPIIRSGESGFIEEISSGKREYYKTNVGVI